MYDAVVVGCGRIGSLYDAERAEARPIPGFLERLRALCDEHGTLLIFDEIITGFRYSLRGAHSLFGVRPDLLSLGKGMANGYALTALAAGLATLRFYQAYDVIGSLYRTGRQLMDGLNQAASRQGLADYVRAAGDFACRPVLAFLDHDGRCSMEHRTLFMQELIRKGVFLNWVCPSFRHGDSEVAQTLDAFDAACTVYRQALEQKSVEGLLEGQPARPVFRTYNQCLQSRCGRLHSDVVKLECCYRAVESGCEGS